MSRNGDEDGGDSSYWSRIWADPSVSASILQKDRIFEITRERFERFLCARHPDLDRVTLLDVGSGDGALLERLPIGSAIFFEPSAPLSRALARRLEDRSGNARAITALEAVEPGTVDVALLHSVVQYMSPSVLEDTLSTLATLLRPTGEVLIADVPHRIPVVDVIGALTADIRTLPQVLAQIGKLAGLGLRLHAAPST